MAISGAKRITVAEQRIRRRLLGLPASLRGRGAGSAAVVAIRLSAALLSYLALAFIARHTDRSAFNDFALIFAAVGFLGPIGTVGQDMVLTKYLPLSRVDGLRGFRTLLCRTFRVLTPSLLTAAAVAVAYSRYALSSAAVLILALVAGCVVINGAAEYLFAVWRSIGSVAAATFAREIIWRIAFVVLLFMVFTTTSGSVIPPQDSSVTALVSKYLVALSASLLALSLYTIAIWRRAPAREDLITPASGTGSAAFFGLTVLNVALPQMDPLILGATGNIDHVGAYLAAQRTVQILYYFSHSAATVAAPAIPPALARGDVQFISRISKQASRTVGAVTIVAATTLALLAPSIMAVFKPEFRSESAILVILCIGPAVFAIGGLHSTLPIMCGLEREYLMWRLVLFICFGAAKLAAAVSGTIEGFAAVSVGEIVAITGVGIMLWRRRGGSWII